MNGINECIGRMQIGGNARSKQMHIDEALKIVQRNRKYKNDPLYGAFLKTVVTGLCEGISNSEILEVIRAMQKTIKPRPRITGEYSCIEELDCS
ncbi:hypothetical protein HK407_01g01400 [Ordospora pajunii]|jgi:hypothetical protein|uniref:uncharacterized protein n=1 Tax=Ordospora pajunii TaxID=3039483 RepID=UPI0029528AF2|nr:uncharacterized protein HK407_01g01400 [Ordospora pajunii]KAH9412247.1 hypothetical protein HK407_01g01400 [Ordospora pajunii]